MALRLPARPAHRLLKPVRETGNLLDLIYEQFAFYARVLSSLPRGFRYRREIVALISAITVGPGALVIGGGMFFVVVSTSFFTGTEVGLEGFAGLQQIGAQAFVGVISSLANTGEIDALEVMGVDSFAYLVSTRVIAAVVTMIPLYLAALFASYIASRLIVTDFFTLSIGQYQHYFRLFLPPIDVVYSFVKALVFAVIVTLIHCYYGYYATGGPAGVGVAAGRAIRASIISVVVASMLMSFMFWGGTGTVQLVG